MTLTLREVATLLGKTARQVRYLIRAGKIEARKVKGRWRIESVTLPLTDAQRAALASRLGKAKDAAEKSFEPLAKAAAPEAEAKRHYSVNDLRSFATAAAIHRDLVASLGDSAASRRLAAAAMLLARGCHSFHPPDKTRRFTEARELVASVVAELLLTAEGEGDPRRGFADRLEQDLIPKMAALIASQEKRSRRSRFERFGGAVATRR